MDGKKSTTTQPGDFLNDFDKSLAAARKAIRRSKEASALAQTAQTHHDKKWQERQLEELKEVKESRRQTRERMAEFHKVSMGILSRLEAEGTEAPADKAKTGKPPQKAGRKPSKDITDRNNEITTMLAAGKSLLQIAKHLDARPYSVPSSWVIVEDDGTTYPVKNFEKAYHDQHLRKKLKGLVYDAQKAHAEVVG